jgi:hypothetical protein
VRARSDQKRTVRSPDRIGYTMRDQAGMSADRIQIRKNLSRFCESLLPPNLEFPTSIPPFVLIEICFSLLAYNLYVMAEPDRKDGLIVWSRRPIEVINRFRCTVISP